MKKMKKVIASVISGLMVAALFASCTKNTPVVVGSENEGNQVGIETSTGKDADSVTENQENDVSKPAKENFSEDTVGQIIELMNVCIGKDIATAVTMVEEFFGTELENTSTLMETQNGVTSNYTVYYTKLYKDELRFNRINFAWNPDSGKVCRVELGLNNDEGEFALSELNPLPDVTEANGMYESFTDEVSSVCGDPIKIRNIWSDEDSYSADYKYKENCIINLKIYNYTEEGGNGLVSFEIFFSNNTYLYGDGESNE